MMLKIQKYSFHVIWRKGKDLIIADTLSRASQPFTEPNNVEEYKVHSVQNLPISDVRIADFCKETSKDLISELVQKCINQGWPDSKYAILFWCVRDKLYISEGLVLRREKLIVPNSLHCSMLSKIHASHLKSAPHEPKIFFIGRACQHKIPKYASSEVRCAEYCTKQQKEPMIVTQVPDCLWHPNLRTSPRSAI